MSRNDDYTTGNLLYYSFHQNYYKFIGVDLPRQKKKTNIPQQVNVIEKLEKENWKVVQQCLFLCSKKTILNFSLDSLLLTE